VTSPLALAAAPLMFALVVIGFRRPLALLLPAYAATVPFGSSLATGLPAPYGSLSSVLGLILLLSLTLQLLSGRTGRAPLPATVAIWLLFLGLTGTSAVWSVAPRITEAGFLNLASLIVLYALLALAPVTRTDLGRVERALVIGGTAAACYGLLQLLVLGGLPTDADGVGGARFGRDLLGANNTAAALLLPLAIAVCRAVDLPRRRDRVLHGLAAGLLVTGILLTGSRGGLLAAGATFLAAILFVGRGRARLAGFTAAAALAVTFTLVVNPAGLGARTASTDSSGRTDIWLVGLAACHDYCLTGSGWGTFPRVYALEQPLVGQARVLVRGTNYEPHNIWILVGVEVGALGLLLVLVGFGLTFRDTVRLRPFLRGPPVAGLTGTLVAGFFLSNFEYKFFWMALMYALLCRNVAQTSPPDAPVPRDSPATIVV
jgi:O-antigen ligase/polysaccharide polymerase Wzy-like membrane protein